MTRRSFLIAALVVASVFCVPPPRSDAWSSTQRCPQYEALLTSLAPKGGWDVRKMSYIAWRESRCVATARSTTRDSGALQVNDIHLPELTRLFVYDIPVTSKLLMNPVVNVWAAARLCEFARRAFGNCYQPWRL